MFAIYSLNSKLNTLLAYTIIVGCYVNDDINDSFDCMYFPQLNCCFSFRMFNLGSGILWVRMLFTIKGYHMRRNYSAVANTTEMYETSITNFEHKYITTSSSLIMHGISNFIIS